MSYNSNLRQLMLHQYDRGSRLGLNPEGLS